MEEQDDQVSMTVEDFGRGEAILEDSSGSETDDEPEHFFGLLKIGEETREYDGVKKAFLAGMKGHAKDTQVFAIYKNSAPTSPMKARFAAFKAFAKLVSQKNGGQGNVNVNYGWYSGSKDEISQIISHGFARCNGQSHGVGVYLSPTSFLLDRLESSRADENDLRHILLCKMIMGKTEVIPAGSKQRYPSSGEFDSGVDNLEAPRRLVFWTAFMNSHILPDYILSFKAPSTTTLLINRMNEIRNLGFVRVSALHLTMVKFLGPAKGALISRLYDDYVKRKVTGVQLFQIVRRITGDDQLLIEIFKSSTNKRVGRAPRKTCAVQAAAELRRR
ncbi:INACTIVE POLY [ADP-RIBOSE] polymerase SRO2-RELATED [Salix koriyanagi]|uniref:INACTIVE POLY [ADP-RIBOSE] polymerase SRO2-RELATED n=1 Tax=Salix koriyanagi TaxID=2511006 RepID=A0A9Q0VC48_9ROSI|nr:INACTIVE POLY [ADP-RIBOSE] polymerase SRO2-RELATED [Salix koriyanagi]